MTNRNSRDNREEFEVFYNEQWIKRTHCQRCEQVKYPKDFNKGFEKAPVCRECATQMTLEEKADVVALEQAKEKKRLDKFKF